jgi:hypothetical protein
VEPLTRGLQPPDPPSLCPPSSTDFVEPLEKNSWCKTTPEKIPGYAPAWPTGDCCSIENKFENFVFVDGFFIYLGSIFLSVGKRITFKCDVVCEPFFVMCATSVISVTWRMESAVLVVMYLNGRGEMIT